jgi:hypothetical protein
MRLSSPARVRSKRFESTNELTIVRLSLIGGGFNRSLQHQHGSNENTNCLRRRYFPKGTDPPALLSGVPSQICPVIHQHPRKTLGLEPACQLAASGVLQ